MGDEADEEDEPVDEVFVDAGEDVGEDPEGLEEEDGVDFVDIPFVVEEVDEGAELGGHGFGGMAVDFVEVEGDGDAGEGEDGAGDLVGKGGGRGFSDFFRGGGGIEGLAEEPVDPAAFAVSAEDAEETGADGTEREDQ